MLLSIMTTAKTEDLTYMYLSGNYNFYKNVDAYAEIYDEDKDQFGFVAGVSVDF
ncbi:hypothetical protein ACLKMH_22380 [Psychromonas sp. KJ10-10]|uniref:hypothetical protein n=1 Tax=Psychromonas sp. KJ10-10 TaxID=3391823 RepID=UPI0039B607CD